MQLSLGIHIRQLRRQLSLTQTELGGERYSKSYVSAVERGSILPSQEALQFFAEQLHQPIDQFGARLQQAQQIKQSYPLISSSLTAADNNNVYDEIMTLLDLMLAGAQPHRGILTAELARFSREAVRTLSLEQQAYYAFLRGLVAQEDGDFADALTSFEFALPLVPEKYKPVILHALGVYYYQMRMFQVALSYHCRSLDLLQKQQEHETHTGFLVQVDLYCGEDCRKLGDYRTACQYYETARRHLQASHNLKIAAELYQGLGYCTYAAIYQPDTSTDDHKQQASLETLDAQTRAFQRALSYLLQSRTLYQTCQDPMGEINTRLLQTMILLDFSAFRQYNALVNSQYSNIHPPFTCESLLDDAEEQCRQALIGCQETILSSTEVTASQLYPLMTVTLAYLTRLHGQRATLARLGGYEDTAARERCLAAVICQEALNASAEQVFTWERLQSILSHANLVFRSPALPRLPDAAHFQHLDPFSRSEIYFTVGELAEELAYSATNADYIDECYLLTNRCFQAAIDALRLLSPQARRDPGYIVRGYQRAIALLKKRAMLAPEQVGDVNSQLFTLLKDGLVFHSRLHPSSMATR
jgi:tetratricopeptide (TPR) repeat protein